MNIDERIVLSVINEYPGADFSGISSATRLNTSYLRRMLADLTHRKFIAETSGQYHLEPGVADAIRQC